MQPECLMFISWMYLISEVELLVKCTFFTGKFQLAIESGDDNFAALWAHKLFANESSVTDDS